MKIANRIYREEELRRRSSSTDLLWGAKPILLKDGLGNGLQMIDVRTAAGLRFWLAQDRCLDIAELSYQGVNIGFFNKNGFVSNMYTNPSSCEFGRYWSGGLLTTCGLRNVGDYCQIGHEFFPPHGRIGFLPARQVCIEENGGLLSIKGQIREASLFGECLDLYRTITVAVDDAWIGIKDEIYNRTAQDEAIFLLYHLNFGFPFLEEDLQVRYPKGEVLPRTDFAKAHLDEYGKLTAPIDFQEEQVYFHLPNEEQIEVCLQNHRLGIQAQLCYQRSQLPILSEWKCMRSGDYVLGIEPGTSLLRGRKKELEEGYATYLKAWSCQSYEWKLSFSNCLL